MGWYILREKKSSWSALSRTFFSSSTESGTPERSTLLLCIPSRSCIMAWYVYCAIRKKIRTQKKSFACVYRKLGKKSRQLSIILVFLFGRNLPVCEVIKWESRLTRVPPTWCTRGVSKSNRRSRICFISTTLRPGYAAKNRLYWMIWSLNKLVCFCIYSFIFDNWIVLLNNNDGRAMMSWTPKGLPLHKIICSYQQYRARLAGILAHNWDHPVSQNFTDGRWRLVPRP